MLRTSLVVALFAASVFPATALERPNILSVQSPAPVKCYCRAQGRTFTQGEKTCLPTPQGGRMAECDIAVNVMSWRFTEQVCPVS
ncbi:hypothetical protein AB4072_07155 [Microvirga sp. 2MCAF38]|uniref:hypothetical protein n=1 Tax=Microvirga sp. 2MCAF38 TaxID=3232989 RepID=UPI003F9CD302